MCCYLSKTPQSHTHTHTLCLFPSSRPLVCLPNTFQPAHSATVPRPTPPTPVTLAAECVSLLSIRNAVCWFGELREEIMFNKRVLFQMRANSPQTCCRQLYCFCLMHGFISASLIYLCSGCLWRHVQTLKRILLKMSQSLTGLLRFSVPSAAAAAAALSDVPARQSAVASGAKVSFRRIKKRKKKTGEKK